MRLSPSLLMSPRALREAVLSFGAVLIGLGAALAFPTVAILLPKFLKAPPAVPEEDAAAAEEPVLSPAEASVVKSRISEFEAMHSEPLNPFKRRVTPPPESAKDNNDEGPSSSESDFSLSSETQPLRRELSTGGARRPLPDFIPTEVATHAIGDEFQPPTAAPLSPSAATAVPVVKRTPRSFSQGVRMADAPAANALGRRTSSDSGGSSSRSSDGGGSLRAASAEPRTLQSLTTPPLEKGAPKWVVGPDPRRQRSGQEEDPEREVLMERISRMARPVAPDILGGGASEGAGAGAPFHSQPVFEGASLSLLGDAEGYLESLCEELNIKGKPTPEQATQGSHGAAVSQSALTPSLLPPRLSCGRAWGREARRPSGADARSWRGVRGACAYDESAEELASVDGHQRRKVPP